MSSVGRPLDDDGANLDAWAAKMLERIGWHDSNWKQIEIYANMPAAKKVATMFSMRRMQMRLLETRLRREHPRSTDEEIRRMVQEHLDLVRESIEY